MILLYILVSWLIADVITGIIHWWQDHYLLDDSKYKIFASISKDNTLHHSKPEAMGYLPMWQNVNTSAPYGLIAALILFLVGAPLIVWLSIFFSSFGNLVHRFAHVPRNKVPVVIQWLQMAGLFISAKHHSVHHREVTISSRQKPIISLIRKENSNTRFCPMTNWMNPVLDFIKFFPFLEYVLRLAGIHTIDKSL